MLKTLRIESRWIECLAQQSRLLDHCKPEMAGGSDDANLRLVVVLGLQIFHGILVI